MKILNLTQHVSTKEQFDAGVREPYDKQVVKDLLTFDEMPTQYSMEERAKALVEIALAEEVESAMIGGAPFFMTLLETRLSESGVKPMYAFSKRITEEKDGVKKSIFVHAGFVESFKP